MLGLNDSEILGEILSLIEGLKLSERLGLRDGDNEIEILGLKLGLKLSEIDGDKEGDIDWDGETEEEID